MSTQSTKKAYPSSAFNGRLTADPVERVIPAKTEGRQATPVLEFDVAVNPTRENLETIYIKAAVFGPKRIESAKAKLAKGSAVELRGDLKARPFIHENKPRVSLELEVAFGSVVVFGEEGQAPTKTGLFAAEATE